MSVIMDYGSDRLARIFFGCLPDEVKKTVFLTLGIPWLFKKISRRKFVVKRSRGWWDLTVIKCDDSYATVIAAGCGSSEVTDIIRLLTKFSCENIIGVGLAGALKKEVQIGDIIVPAQAIPAFAKNMNEAIKH
jgi:purine-nucleoside phosphorylase